jgi:hypothetical protein
MKAKVLINEEKDELSGVLKVVDEDRKYVIQATIVRCVSRSPSQDDMTRH